MSEQMIRDETETNGDDGCVSVHGESGSIRGQVGAHTPGPWVASDSGDAVTTTAALPGRCHGYGCDNTFICSLNDGEYHEYSDEAEQLANATLIAAAPDLYAALTALVAIYDDEFGIVAPEMDAALAALAKAAGR